MKRLMTLLCFVLFLGLGTPTHALSTDQNQAIQTLLDEACQKSGVPGMSLSLQIDGEVKYFSSGYRNRELQLPASEETLFELASVSKAFTGLGILLLSEQGRLSLTDPVSSYLPWLTFKYRGQPVQRGLTLNNFLHHTSGIVNGRQTQSIPEGNSPEMLQQTVETLIDQELAFAPGTRYQYGTLNYDVLGLVIEKITGETYEHFMTNQLFQPLGLHQTYAYREQAQATGNLAQGYRTSFFVTMPYEAPVYRGNKPAGYLISNIKDMARWLGIQLGEVTDIPDVFKSLIEKSHQPNTDVLAVNNRYYAAGWSVSEDRRIVEHLGGNPNFRTQVMAFPEDRLAISLLSNGANTNTQLVLMVKAIVAGNLDQSYKMSGSQLLDSLLSMLSIICLCAATLLLFASKKGKSWGVLNKRLMTRSLLGLALGLCLTSLILAIVWPTIFVWQTYSLLSALLSLAMLAFSLARFVGAGS